MTQPMPRDAACDAKSRLLRLYVGLAASGLLVSGYLEWIHLRLFTDPAYEAFCHTGSVFDCQAVALSPTAVVGGAPLAVWGMLGYLWCAILGIATMIRRGQVRALALAAAVISTTAMALLALVLVGFSALFLGAACQLCLASHAITFAMTAAALALFRRTGHLRPLDSLRLVVAWAAGQKMMAAIVIACGATAIIAVTVFVPPYWTVASYRNADEVPSGVDEEGLPWIGATQPLLIVHEYHDYECQFCRTSHLKLRRLLASHKDALRIVRHDTARIQCPISARPGEYVDACRTVRGAYCAQQQGRFWPWNDGAILTPKPGPGPTRTSYEEGLAASLGLDLPPFTACLDSPEAFAHAAKGFRQAAHARVTQLPAHKVDGKNKSLAEIADWLSER